jgi:hypothetical protein
MTTLHCGASARQIPDPIQVNDTFADRIVVVRRGLLAGNDRPA